jgi:hypothetical protein
MCIDRMAVSNQHRVWVLFASLHASNWCPKRNVGDNLRAAAAILRKEEGMMQPN